MSGHLITRVVMQQNPVFFRLDMTPSNNEIKGSNWYVYKKLKKYWDGVVFAAAYQAGWRKWFEPYQNMRVTFSGCGYDRDNAVGGFKPVQDVIKDWRMIKDDRTSACLIEYCFDDDSEEKGVFVKLF